MLVFVRSKERAQQLYRELVASPGMRERVGVIHADRTQSQVRTCPLPVTPRIGPCLGAYDVLTMVY